MTLSSEKKGYAAFKQHKVSALQDQQELLKKLQHELIKEEGMLDNTNERHQIIALQRQQVQLKKQQEDLMKEEMGLKFDLNAG